jgi:DNA repair exonuclease SbcCD ATPase subunit
MLVMLQTSVLACEIVTDLFPSVTTGNVRRRTSGNEFSWLASGNGPREFRAISCRRKGLMQVLEQMRTGLREMPSNAAWLLSRVARPAGGAAAGVRDRGRMVTAALVDAAPYGDSVEIRARRAREAAERAREAERRAVEAARESKALADHARAVSERGHGRLQQLDRELTRRIKQRVAQAEKEAEELVRRERESAETEAEEQREEVEEEVEDEISHAESDAEAAQQRAEQLVEDAAEELAEARRLADEAAEAARVAAEDANRQAQELQNDARQRARDAESRIDAAEKLREQAAATAKRTALELDREAMDGLDSYKKPELVHLAASIGIEGRSEMTKDELVEAITKEARRRARQSTQGARS